MATHSNRNLLSLADEILLSIIEHVDSNAALSCLAATCSKLRGLVEPFIWRELLVTRDIHSTKVITALLQSNRFSYIQDLAICYRQDANRLFGAWSGAIAYMGKLRHLKIESPCPNNPPIDPFWDEHCYIDYTRLIRHSILPEFSRPFSMLQSLSLHAHGVGQSKFDFGENALIFLHPTLRDLTISCSNFTSRSMSQIPPEKLKSTPLRSLTFIECNVYLDLLNIVLSLPRALKRLSVGERLHVFDGCQPTVAPRTTNPQFLEILRKQSDSLEHLNIEHGSVFTTHLGREFGGSSPTDKHAEGSHYRDLHSLDNLQYLELGIHSVYSKYLAEGGCPGSLKTLRLSDQFVTCRAHIGPAHTDGDSYSLHFCNVFRIARDIHRLSSKGLDCELLFVHKLRKCEPVHVLPFYWRLYRYRKLVYDFSNMVKDRGCRFRIFGQAFEGGETYIPPYLHGEETPKEVMLYNSDQYWKFFGKDYQTIDDESLGPVDHWDPDAMELEALTKITVRDREFAREAQKAMSDHLLSKLQAAVTETHESMVEAHYPV
ncbi:hypothetical protein BCR34DRAFT_586056 [Clohesyomyces aquaticus]|uniref:F-box domain-containing protein n=1 Tax=Clohesyomyces aquaticus TaxID=1231657 RepID=A0A1Y1ZUW0_9PLEO|nr:hypothetical protein BCR34DRAFT_586056 [Clohesyomyces aquaticus]